MSGKDAVAVAHEIACLVNRGERCRHEPCDRPEALEMLKDEYRLFRDLGDGFSSYELTARQLERFASRVWMTAFARGLAAREGALACDRIDDHSEPATVASLSLVDATGRFACICADGRHESMVGCLAAITPTTGMLSREDVAAWLGAYAQQQRGVFNRRHFDGLALEVSNGAIEAWLASRAKGGGL